MTLVPIPRLSEMPSILFLPSIEEHSFSCCCFPQIQPSFLVIRPSVFWEWDKVVVKMSNIGSLWVIRYAWQLLSNENFDWHFLETTCWPMWTSYKIFNGRSTRWPGTHCKEIPWWGWMGWWGGPPNRARIIQLPRGCITSLSPKHHKSVEVVNNRQGRATYLFDKSLLADSFEGLLPRFKHYIVFWD